MSKPVCFQPIGIIHSPFKNPEGTPIQPPAAKDIEGTIEVFPDYAEGLKDLDGFSHICLIYHFHLARRRPLAVKPFLDSVEHGVFATRAPSRPNAIGLSIARLIKIDKTTLTIRDVDIVDNTPLLDIKPYVPAFDVRHADRIGWLEGKEAGMEGTKADSRFT